MKTWKRIVRLLILVVIILPVATMIAIQVPAIQTYAVDKVAGVLTKNLDGTAHVGKVYFSYPNSLILKDIDLIQGADDTVAHLGKLLVKVKASSLLGNEARIRRVSLENGHFTIRRYDDSTTNLSRLLAPMKNQPPKEKKEKDPEAEKSGPRWNAINLDRLNIKHIDFALDSSLALQDINFSARHLHYGPDGASGRIDNLTLRKGDDLAIHQLSTELQYDPAGSASLRNFRYEDDFSHLNADYLILSFNDKSDLSQFMEKVKLEASLYQTRFDMRTLHPFLPKLQKMQFAGTVEGKISGTVSDLQTEHLRVATGTGKTVLDIKCRVKGLPHISQTQFIGEVLRGETTTEDIAQLVAGLSPKFKPTTLSRLAPGEQITLTAQANGPLSHLQSHATVYVSTLGHADVDALVQIKKHQIDISGKASTAELQLDRILGISSLGALDCQTDVVFAKHGKNLDIDIEPLNIDHIRFNGYDYSGLVASGTFRNGAVHADILSKDPNLVLAGRTDLNLGGKGKDSRYVVDLDVDLVDLNAIHLDQRDSAAVSLKLNADIVQTADGAFLGQAKISDMQAYLPGQLFRMGDIALDSKLEDGFYAIRLDSELFRGVYDGNIFVRDFIDESIHLLYQDNLEHLFGGHHSRKDDVPNPEQFGSFNLQVLNLKPLTDFFLPSLFVSPYSTVRADLLNEEFTLNVSSELAAVEKLLLQNLQLRCLTEGERILAFVDVDRLQASGMMAEHIDIDAQADSVINLQFAFHNDEGPDTYARLNTRVSFPDARTDPYPVRIDLLPSELAIAGHPWEIAPASVRYRKEDIKIEDFALSYGEQSLYAGGIIGPKLTDTVRLMMNDFDLGFANSFLTKPLNLQGLLTGQGEAFALTGPEKGILFDLHARYVSAVGIDMGHFMMQSHWDDPAKQFIFSIDNTMGERHPVVANATLRPSDKHLNLDVQLDSLALGVVEPLITGLASDMDGSVSGHIQAHGPLNKLAISSENTRLNQFKFKLDFTQVDYIADGPFLVRDDGVTFENVQLFDRFGHEGQLTGNIPYDHFKDIRLNLRIDLKDMMALNTGSQHNNSFYGRAFADGSVRVSGPLNKIRLSLNLTPTQNTTIHIPLGASASASKSLLTFINNESKISLIDSVIQAHNAPEKTKGGSTDVSVNLRLNATPDAEIQLEVDKKTGDILKARGNGRIGITVDRDKFDIKGDYEVQSGSYHFGMLGITARDFSINPGGTIAFNGDVMQSDLDLTATYRTKASISPLIADSTAVGTRRTVDCGISVTGKLENPEIRFYVDIPDLDPTTKGRVETALNTEDKRMKQALALLISGGFVPDEQSGIVNSTTLLFSNASELMSSQLNNIFRQLDIPLDLGFNYQPTESGRNIFDVAVSTQLFNNRVIINGNIGNRQYMTSSSRSDIVGDLDIEIKLNRQGQLRLTLFSHSADQYSNYLDQSQRNGAGIVYQEDFNSFQELWRKIFHIKTPANESQALPDPNAPRRIRTE